MPYSVLTSDTITTYINQTKALRHVLGDGELQISEIGDGNLNYVFLVQSLEKSIILKQAVPYLRCVGEGWALSRDRMQFEIAALQQFHALTPQHIPEVLHVDEPMSLVALQYLGNHLITRKGIIASIKYPKLAEHAATFLSETLFKTSSYYLSSTNKRILEQRFNTNHDLCKLTEDFVFTFPYVDHDSNAILPEMQPLAKTLQTNWRFKQNVMALKYAFMTQRDALLHGDLHTGSLMSNEQETFVIDPEFAFVGPFGFDIGALVANLLLAYVSHQVCDPTHEYADWLLDSLNSFLNHFKHKFTRLWTLQTNSALLFPDYFDAPNFKAYQDKTMLQILRQSIGFAGCKMTRRILGIAGVADIREIQDPALRLQAEQLALNLGVRLVETYTDINSLEDFMQHIKACCPSRIQESCHP